jgi:hypothetical protein
MAWSSRGCSAWP